MSQFQQIATSRRIFEQPADVEQRQSNHSQHGLRTHARTSMRRIAEEPSAAPSALHWHVRNKNGLLQFVLDRCIRDEECDGNSCKSADFPHVQ